MLPIKLSRTQSIALISLLVAINVASRIFLQFLPNFKPVTSIIILSVQFFGLSFALKLSVVSVLVSNLFLGMGLWTFFQILAWIVICLLTKVFLEFLTAIHLKSNAWIMGIFAFFMGYVFGFIVSLDKFMIGGPLFFMTYYLSGLLFDTIHALGNLLFYIAMLPLLMTFFKKTALRKADNL